MPETTEDESALSSTSDTAVPTTPVQIVAARKRASWLIGVVYAIIVGPSLLLEGLQATILGILFAAICYWLTQLQHKERLLLSPTLIYCFIATLTINSISFSLNANPLVLGLNWLLQLFIGSMLLITFATAGMTPQTVGSYVSSLLRLLVSVPGTFIFYRAVSHMFSRTVTQEREPYDDRKWISVIIVSGLLAIIHAMFAEINEEYQLFMESLFRYVWKVIKYLYDLDIITLCLVSVVMACLSFAAFSTVLRRPSSAPRVKVHVDLKYLDIVLTPLILLFLVFSFFQSKLLFVDPSALSYKQLSLYVQKGFWELLLVSFLGGAVYCAAMERMTAAERAAGKGRLLLLIFAAELLLLTAFSQHKLVVQQLLFGFRDRRVLASLGVLLLSVSFVCFLLQALDRISPALTFSIQYWGLAAIVLVLSSINLEQAMLHLSPIRFSYNGKVYKDYAYLFTNSTDNAASWLELMDEAEQTGIPVPKEYYWKDFTGGYSSLCEGKRYGNTRVSTFAELQTGLEEKYGPKMNTDLRSLAKFNFSEFRAYGVLKDNTVRVQRFLEFIERQCNGEWSELRTILQRPPR